VGFGATRAGLFTEAQLQVLGRFVVLLPLPLLLFTAVSQRNMLEVMNARYALGYAVGSLAAFGTAFAWARRWRAAPVTLAAMQGLGASTSNSGYLGLPIAMQVLGPAAAGPVAVAFLVENMITIPLALALADAAWSASRADAASHSVHRSAWGTAWQTFRGMLRNPLLLAVVAGLLFSLTGWALPPIAQRAVSMLAASATPVALLVIGGSLVGLNRHGMQWDVARIAGIKLIVHPAAVGVALWLLLPGEPKLVQAGMLMAAMPMVGVFTLLSQRYQHQALAAATILVTTAVSFVTINALLMWMR
jgi:malonate transporter and related proteins